MYKFDAKEFNNNVMNGFFRKVYPVIAKQVVDLTGITKGICIDLGGGPGMLAISLAKITDLNVIVYDITPECIELVKDNCLKNDMPYGRVEAMQGKAEDLKFEDNSIDLVVSRGSIFFWEDQPKGLSEVYRVLKPGGWAYIGGGFGSQELLDEILAMRANDNKWSDGRKERMKKNPPEHYVNMIEQLGIDGRVEYSEAGTWIIFQKK